MVFAEALALGLEIIGGDIEGGFYGEFPSLEEGKQVQGDMAFTNDFRGTYSTILDRWMGLDPVSITGGNYEQLQVFK